MPTPTIVPLSSWRSYLTAEGELLPHCYRVSSYEELVRFLLERRCDCSQLSTVLYLCELLRHLEDFQPTLMRIFGDIVRFPGRIVRGRTLVLVEGGLEKAIIAEAGSQYHDVSFSSHSLLEQYAILKRTMAMQTRILPEVLDKESAMAQILMQRFGDRADSPFIDVYRPNGNALYTALDNTINDFFPSND